MSDELIVVGTFAIVYAAIIGYATWLHLRMKKAGRSDGT
jgi:hypothetical protein